MYTGDTGNTTSELCIAEVAAFNTVHCTLRQVKMLFLADPNKLVNWTQPRWWDNFWPDCYDAFETPVDWHFRWQPISRSLGEHCPTSPVESLTPTPASPKFTHNLMYFGRWWLVLNNDYVFLSEATRCWRSQRIRWLVRVVLLRLLDETSVVTVVLSMDPRRLLQWVMPYIQRQTAVPDYHRAIPVIVEAVRPSAHWPALPLICWWRR